MATWKEILSDPSKFPDDFVITTKDGETFKLGDARAYDKETRGQLTAQLTAKETALAAEKKQLERASDGVMEMFNKYLELTGLTQEEALAGKKPTKKNVAEANELDENDPLVGALVKEVNTLKKELQGVTGQLTDAKEKILKPMLGTYLDDYYHDRWEDRIEPNLPKEAKGKIKLEDVMKHAEKEGYKDSKGRLNLSKAAEDLTADYRFNERLEKELEKRKQTWKEEESVAAMQRPGSPASRGVTPKNFKDEKGRTKSFDQVLQEAANDQELWAGLAKA